MPSSPAYAQGTAGGAGGASSTPAAAVPCAPPPGSPAAAQLEALAPVSESRSPRPGPALPKQRATRPRTSTARLAHTRGGGGARGTCGQEETFLFGKGQTPPCNSHAWLCTARSPALPARPRARKLPACPRAAKLSGVSSCDIQALKAAASYPFVASLHFHPAATVTPSPPPRPRVTKPVSARLAVQRGGAELPKRCRNVQSAPHAVAAAHPATQVSGADVGC
jgi:hypothetical protein